MRNQRFVSIGGALLAALLLAGCGGDDNDETVSKAAFIKQVDATCAEEQKKARAATRADLDAVIESAVAALEAEAKEIESLGAPRGDEEEIDAILANVHKTIDLVEEDPSKASGAASQTLARAEKLADAYGLKNCLLG